MMSAYIDLNPVRAGIVSDPKDYRWCSYAQACAGKAGALEGVKQVVDTLAGLRGGRPVGLKRSLETYRCEVMLRGQAEGVAIAGNPLCKGVSEHRIKAVIEKRGTLTPQEALLCRVRFFCDGVVIGSQQSVDDVFEEQRWRFGAKRTSGARKIKCISAQDLCALRDLQVNLIG
jgi:hypothetical protein